MRGVIRERTLYHGKLRVVLWSQGRCLMCCLVTNQVNQYTMSYWGHDWSACEPQLVVTTQGWHCTK